MKRVKKLLALALAGIMVLSCTIFASATTPPSPSPQYTGGSQSGEGIFESILPEGTIKIVVPTFVADEYDMILDPHSLIKETGAARYTPSGANAETPEFEFGDDDNPVYLFFHNLAEDAEYDYSSKSDTADVVNKSSFEVDVKVSVEVDKGLAGSSFELVDKDEVATAEGAAMYLGLEVVDAESNTDISATPATDTVTVADGAEPQVIAVSLDEDADKVDAAPSVGVTGTSVGTGSGNDSVEKKEQAAAIISDINVVFAAGATASDKQEVIAALTKSRAETSTGANDSVTAASIAIVYTKASGQVVLTTTIPTKTTAPDTFIPETYTAAAKTVSIKSAAGRAATTFDPTNAEHLADSYFSIPVTKSVTINSTTTSVTVAKIRGKVSAAKALAANDDAVAAAAFTGATAQVAPLSSASYTKELGAYSSAYAYVFKNTDANNSKVGEYILAYYSDDTTTGFNNSTTAAAATLDALKDSLEPAKGLRFNLVGAINPSDDWDNLEGEANNIDIAVIWDVSEAESRATKPTLSVDTAVTGSASSVTFKWTAGSGKYADYRPHIGSGGAKYSQNGTAKTLTTGNGTTSDTFKVNGLTSSIRTAATNTNYVVVFKSTDTSKADLEIAFPSGWYS